MLYWLICSAHRMSDGMAVIAYYDQHISLIRWFGARFGYRVIRANGDLNLSGNHLQMSKKMRAIFDTWLIIMPSASGLAARRAAQAQWMQQNAQSAVSQQQQQPATQAVPQGVGHTGRPHASTMQSAPSAAGAGQVTGDAYSHPPSRASTLPTGAPHVSSSRLSVSDSVTSDGSTTQAGSGIANPAIPGTPSTMSPPMSPASRPIAAANPPGPSRQSSTTSSMQPATFHENAVSATGVQAPYHPKTIAMEKLENVAAAYNSVFVPLCNQFLQTQFPNVTAMRNEHTALTEGILAQVVLKLDDVDIQGDEVARLRRKGLIEEVQGTLAKLDNRLRVATDLETQVHTGGAAHVQTHAPSQYDAPPQPGISRQYTFPPEFHSTVSPAELSGGLGFVELPGSMPTAANMATLPMRSELPSTTSSTTAPKPAAVRRKAPPPPRKVMLATALYSFEPEEADGDELTFNEGDVIEIVEKTKELEADGWCRARVKGQRRLGLVPLDYLEVHPGQAPLPAKAPARPMAALAETEGENPPAPTNPVSTLGERPMFMHHGTNAGAGPAGAAPPANGAQQQNAQVEPIKPVTFTPAQPANVLPPIANQGAPVQPIQPVQLTPPANDAAQRPSAGDPSQAQPQPAAHTTPPPPYEAGPDHASTVGNGAAAQYYAEGHQADAAAAAAAAGAAETMRSGKVLTPLPPGITNPNHNAGTFIATQIFNRPKPQQQDSTDSQMSPGEGEVAMRGLGAHPAGPSKPAGSAKPSSPPAGGPAARPPSVIQGAPGGQAQPAPRPTAYGHQAPARPPGQAMAAGQQGRPNRASPPAQAGGSNVAQNNRGFGNILGGVGRIIASNRRNNNNNNNTCGGCNKPSCANCGGQNGANDDPTGAQYNATLTASGNPGADQSQEYADLRNSTVSPLDQTYGAPLDSTTSVSSCTSAAPSTVMTQPDTTVISSDAGFTFLSDPGDPGAGNGAFDPASDPSGAGFSFASDSAVAASPLAGLAPPSSGGGDASYFAGASPLAGLATASGGGDAMLSTPVASTEGVSPLAGLAVMEESSTVDLGGGMTTTTTTTTVATDADGGVVGAAVETDVSGAPIGGADAALADETAGQSGWGAAGDYDGGDYGNDDEGDWQF